MKYVIATHGKLAQGYEDTIKLVVPTEQVYPICAYEEGLDFPENMERLMASFDKSETVIVFTDLICGSVTQKIMELWGTRENFYLFAGVNLPFVMEIILNGDNPTQEDIEQSIESAREQLICVSGLLQK